MGKPQYPVRNSRDGSGRAYVMKDALADGPAAFEDSATTMTFGRILF